MRGGLVRAHALLLLALAVIACGRGRPREIRIATGLRGGTFLPLGETLARGFSHDVHGVRFTAIESPGSVASLEMLDRGEAQMALVSNHVPASSAVRLVAVLYEETLQVVVRDDAAIATPFDLRGHRVSVGASGSGTESIANAVLHHFGIEEGSLDRRNTSTTDAADALERGELDAAFFVAGMRTPIIDRLLARTDLHLLSLGDPSRVGSSLEGIRLDAPYFAVAAIPEHAYGRQPTEPIGTITVRACLVVRSDLDEDLVYDVTQSLFDHKVELATEQRLLSHLTETFDRALSPYALHPGADRYYRRSDPTFVQRYTDQISLGITVGALVWSAITAFTSARRARRRDRVEARLTEVAAIALRGQKAATRRERQAAIDALVEARDRALAELAAEKLDANDSFVILQQYVAARIAELERGLAALPDAVPAVDEA
jgi:TRAP transporter TAXI family solute receptor